MSRERFYTISGWGFDRSFIDEVSDTVNLSISFLAKSVDEPYFTFDRPSSWVIELEKNISDQSTIIAWSMGAMLALELVKYFPQKVKKLVLFSPCLSFVKSDLNPFGVNEDFLDKMIENIQLGVPEKERTMQSFYKRSFSPKSTDIHSLQNYSKVISEKELVFGLNYLKTFQLSDFKSNVPALIFHGDCDKIINYRSSECLKDVLSKSERCVLPKEGHYLDLSHCKHIMDSFLYG